jgi:hypothetical protein
MLRLAVYFAFNLLIQTRTALAQTDVATREQAILRAVLFVRGSASEELRVVPPDSITFDATRLPDTTATTPAVLAKLGQELRAHVVPELESRCARAGLGMTAMRALFTRAECATGTSKYYVEPGDLQVRGSTAVVMVHVFRRPTRSTGPVISRVDYAGYKVELTLGSDGWGSPRVVSITET